jgi:excinuclease ABC subunit C
MVRAGRHLGDRCHFPVNAFDSTPEEALAAFLLQHYGQHPAPEKVLVDPLPSQEDDEVETSLQAMLERPLPLLAPRSQTQRAWVEMARQNASLAIQARNQASEIQGERLLALQTALGLAELPRRIECFDISHTQGEATVASCVVYQDDGMRRSDYRRYNIKDVPAGDDYAAMRQAVSRRYDKLAEGEGAAPDLILIDGGKGQVGVAYAAMTELGLAQIPMLGVAKGEARKPGLETLIFPEGREPLQLPAQHPALHLIQEIRDEAHRFAITGHRAQRGKARRASRLEEIPGVGPARRKALIAHFGGLPGVATATIEQIASVEGISLSLAEKIYAALH